MSKYSRFCAMIVSSAGLMFLLTYLTTYSTGHVFFNETRFYMALIMGASMALVMLLFMREMYADKRKNLAITVTSSGIFLVALWLIRSQILVDDVAYMKAMIPHHSIAILASRQARIRDPRVRRLANGIIATQEREIHEMKRLIADLDAHPANASAPPLQAPPESL